MRPTLSALLTAHCTLKIFDQTVKPHRCKNLLPISKQSVQLPRHSWLHLIVQNANYLQKHIHDDDGRDGDGNIDIKSNRVDQNFNFLYSYLSGGLSF